MELWINHVRISRVRPVSALMLSSLFQNEKCPEIGLCFMMLQVSNARMVRSERDPVLMAVIRALSWHFTLNHSGNSTRHFDFDFQTFLSMTKCFFHFVPGRFIDKNYITRHYIYKTISLIILIICIQNAYSRFNVCVFLSLVDTFVCTKDSVTSTSVRYLQHVMLMGELILKAFLSN